MFRIIMLLAIISLSFGLELPEQPHKGFGWWLDVEINDIRHRVRILENGNIEISYYRRNQKIIDGQWGKVGKEWTDKAYALSLQAVKSIKINEYFNANDKEYTGRLLLLDYDFNAANIILSIREDSLKDGIYQELVEHVLNAEKDTGIQYVPPK